MNTKRYTTILMALIVAIFATACGGAVVDPTPEPPPPTVAVEPTAEPEPTEVPQPTVGDIAMADDSFTMLVDAVLATGLDTVVQGDDPVTVLAPTNAAFEALPEGLLESLTEDQLRTILSYHVVAGRVPAEAVAGMATGTSVLGEDFTITVDGDTIMVNDATVIAADIEGSNGIIHVIDKVLVPPSIAEELAAASQTVGDIAMADDSFTILVDAVIATGLVDVVQGDDPVTVLAPTNAAFEALPEGLLESLSEDQLRTILTYHVVEGRVPAEAVAGMATGTSVLGEDFTITVDGDTIMVNDATVIAADIEGSNGIIHVIDKVLIPPSIATAMLDTVGDIAMADDSFTILVDAVIATDLVDVVQGEEPVTVFAPTNAAFEALPEGLLESLTEDQLRTILTYHVVEGRVMAEDVTSMAVGTSVLGEKLQVTVDGDKVMINDANIVTADIEGSNGIIHVIDKVLIPPSLATADFDTVGDIAMADNSFTTLVDAVIATDLVDVVQGEDPVTIFAPTNDAFAALPEGLLESLTEDQLRDILTYHVVPGRVTANEVVSMDAGTSVLGEDFTITVDGDTVMINDATIVAADIEGSNGIIHVIDKVLIPPSYADAAMGAMDTVGDIAMADDSFTILVDAVIATDLVDVVQGDDPVTILAPTNAAFEALPEGLLESLTEDQLREILTYHVIAGRVPSDAVAGMASGTSVLGETFEITVDGDTIMVNDATVITADIEGSNGIIHVIDKVLIPPSMQP